MEDTPAQSSQPAPAAFEFTGTGGDYFRIWIVNIALTIVTAGIYSAWAKVRRLQYFYRNTRVAGASFDYHGKSGGDLQGPARSPSRSSSSTTSRASSIRCSR